ncbi:MAG: hypothetical protein J1F05_01740 [Muribaculaceae bacterium]|nr:hypothetical protein [Muribaculaceae bacterium]
MIEAFNTFVSSQSNVMFIVAAVLLLITHFAEKNGVNVLVVSLLLIAVGAAEIYGKLVNDYDPTSILDSWSQFFFGLLVFVVLLGVVFFQYGYTMLVVDKLSDYGNFTNKYRSFTIVTIIAIVAFIIAEICKEKYVEYVLLVYGICVAYILLYSIYSAIKNKGNILYAVLSTIVFAVMACGILFICMQYILLFIVVIFLMARTPSRCDSCRSYSDGYCYYRNKYVEPGNSCNKFQP